jgi:hypothetical protein
MANAAQSSKYEILTITKGNRTVRLDGKTTSFDYYESVLSPNVTAVMTFIDTGGSVSYDGDYDSQERIGSIYNALPITGQEEVRFKIKSKLGTLDFSNNPLYVNGALNPGEESNRQGVALSLVSKTAILNQEATVFKKYSGNIGDSVRKLVKEYLPGYNVAVDAVSNSYSFIGNSKSVFDVICSLGPKSVPGGGGNPGFFFYETREGLNYKSIDTLITQNSSEPNRYFRTDALRSGVSDSVNDFKISSMTVSKNQDVINALKSGVYYSRNLFFDPKTFKYEEIIYQLSSNGIKKSLGKNASLINAKNFTRTHYHIKDVGTLEPTPAGNVNNDPKEWQAKSTMRYNILFTQVLDVQVPCNPNLKAGDTINCDFEIVTQGKKEQGIPDPVQSGKYLIIDLCHHFDPKRSFTSMRIVRDSYGLYTNKNKS